MFMTIRPSGGFRQASKDAMSWQNPDLRCGASLRLPASACTLGWSRRHGVLAQHPGHAAGLGRQLGPGAPPLYTECVKIALGQINPTVGDFSGNAGKIIDFSRRAQTAGAGLILFPELSVCGYPPRDLVERPSFVTRNRETAERIAVETQGIGVICGLVTPADSDAGKSVLNSAALLMDGKVAFVQSKKIGRAS